jgi:small GTP-binding protein
MFVGRQKVVVVGAANTGKTCIIGRYISGEFPDNPVTMVSPTFVETSVPVGDRTVTIEIWDTAGAERFRALSHLFYRGAEAGIVVFSIVESDSLARAKEEINGLRQERGDDIKVFVVGNKCDLVRERAVTDEDARKFAQSFNARYFETSAKTGLNIAELFTAVAESLLLDSLPQQPSGQKKSLVGTVGLTTPTKESSDCC